jgi:hypothetical protein
VTGTVEVEREGESRVEEVQLAAALALDTPRELETEQAARPQDQASAAGLVAWRLGFLENDDSQTGPRQAQCSGGARGAGTDDGDVESLVQIA